MERLLLLRKGLKMTQTEFADILNIKQSSYASIESGRNSLTDRNAELLSNKLGINKNWLLTGLGDMRSGHEDVNIDDDITKAIEELTEKGKPIGGNVVPYEFVQALLDERKRHDEKEMELLNQNRQLMELLNSRLDGFEKRIINASMENARDVAVNE